MLDQMEDLFGMFLEAVCPDGPGLVDKPHVEDDPPTEFVELPAALLAAVQAVVQVDHLKGNVSILIIANIRFKRPPFAKLF